MARLWVLKFKKFIGAHLTPDDFDKLVQAGAARALGETPSQTLEREAQAKQLEAQARQHDAQAELFRAQALETLARTLREADRPLIVMHDGTRVGVRDSESVRIYTLDPATNPVPVGLSASELVSLMQGQSPGRDASTDATSQIPGSAVQVQTPTATPELE